MSELPRFSIERDGDDSKDGVFGRAARRGIDINAFPSTSEWHERRLFPVHMSVGRPRTPRLVADPAMCMSASGLLN